MAEPRRTIPLIEIFDASVCRISSRALIAAIIICAALSGWKLCNALNSAEQQYQSDRRV